MDILSVSIIKLGVMDRNVNFDEELNLKWQSSLHLLDAFGYRRIYEFIKLIVIHDTDKEKFKLKIEAKTIFDCFSFNYFLLHYITVYYNKCLFNI